MLFTELVCDALQQEEEQQQQPTGEAPKFKRGLTALNVELSKPFKLDCEVEAVETPRVSWYRNGIELEGPRYVCVLIGVRCTSSLCQQRVA